jgi:histidinol-phosphate/aromatic aminotransferase/cobyric acid decarboxylase-like protein
MLDLIPKEVTVLLDEAYVEYANYSGLKLLNSYPNLVILRTFSKAFALASQRLGYIMCSDTDFVREFTQEHQYPYPIASFSVALGIELMKRKSVVLDAANKTKILRAELTQSLVDLGKKKKSGRPLFVKASDSSANFVLFQCKNSGRIAQELLQTYNIAVKYIEKLAREKKFLRITVGTRELNERLLFALRRVTTE